MPDYLLAPKPNDSAVAKYGFDGTEINPNLASINGTPTYVVLRPDGEFAVGRTDDGIEYYSADGTQQWTTSVYGRIESLSFYNGTGDLYCAAGASVFRFDATDGSEVFRAIPDDRPYDVAFDSNGDIEVALSDGGGRRYKIDQLGASLIDDDRAFDEGVKGVTYDSNGTLFGLDEFGGVYKYDGYRRWDNYDTAPYGEYVRSDLRIDTEGNLYVGSDSRVVKIDSTGSTLWKAGIGKVWGVHPLPDGRVLATNSSNNEITEISADGNTTSTLTSVPGLDGNQTRAGVQPTPNEYPSDWIQSVTKSASATQVASSATQRTASGAITGSASATTLTSSATPQTPSGTSTADVTATEATSSTTQQTPGATGLASVTATETASTATMPTVSADRGLLTSATQYVASTTMASASGAEGLTTVASNVSASSGLATPSITTGSWPDLSTFRVARDQSSGTLYEYSRDLSLTDVGSFSTGFGGVPIDEDGARYIKGSGVLLKYDRTGTEIWNTDLTSRSDYGGSAISITESYVYVGLEFDGSYHTIYELDKSDGTITNSYETSILVSNIGDLVAPTDRDVYLLTGDDSVISVDVVDGATEWTTSISGQGLSTHPDGTPYTIDTNDNTLTSFDPATGSTSTYGLSFGTDVGLRDARFTVDGELIIHTSTSSGDRIGRYTTGGTAIWKSSEYNLIADFQIDPRGGAFISYNDGSSYNLVKIDESGSQIHSASNDITSFGYYPSAATFPSLWYPNQTASVSLNKTPSDSTPRSPISAAITTSSATPTPGSATMSTPVGGGEVSAGATAVASSSTLFAPDANGQVGASSTRISASSAPNTSTGTGVASPTANPYPSTASMRVVEQGKIAFPTATPIGATTSMSAPNVESRLDALASLVPATVGGTVDSTGITNVSPTPAPVQGGLRTPLSDGTALASGMNLSATSGLQTGVGTAGLNASASTIDASVALETPSIARLAVDVGADASTSATMQLPVSDIGATAVASTYGAVADPRVPLIGLDVLAQKYDATVELRQPLEFVPRTTALEGDGPTIAFTGRGSGPNGVDIDSSKE